MITSVTEIITVMLARQAHAYEELRSILFVGTAGNVEDSQTDN
jgi:hypothetical protein